MLIVSTEGHQCYPTSCDWTFLADNTVQPQHVDRVLSSCSCSVTHAVSSDPDCSLVDFAGPAITATSMVTAPVDTLDTYTHCTLLLQYRSHCMSTMQAGGVYPSCTIAKSAYLLPLLQRMISMITARCTCACFCSYIRAYTSYTCTLARFQHFQHCFLANHSHIASL